MEGLDGIREVKVVRVHKNNRKAWTDGTKVLGGKSVTFASIFL
jgi:hypothetical protein